MTLWPVPVSRELKQRAEPLIAELAEWRRSEHIDAPIEESLPGLYLPMASWLAGHVLDDTVVVGLNGAQGTGKSTLARILARVIEALFKLRVAVLSLDDFYLTAEQRLARAQAVHPLLATRGVPGTHDVALALQVVDGLRQGEANAGVSLPSFDKATDDRRPIAQWPIWHGRCDLVIFEGWCMGARSELPSALRAPANDLERLDDPTGGWREYVNAQLGGPYQRLFRELDLLMMLRPPSFEHVFKWRDLQEQKLREGATPGRGMTPEQVRVFVMHFERLTRFMLEEMPARADVVVDLGEDHQPAHVTLGDVY